MNDAHKPEPIEVTVTFLEMGAPPTHYPHLPMGRQIALLKTRDIPLHFYRYLQDRIGRKWQWVNVLRLSDEELSAKVHAPGRDIRVLYPDGAPAGTAERRMYTSPRAAPPLVPPGPSATASTSGEFVTQLTVTSLAAATSAGDPAPVAPISRSACIRFGFRFQTVTLKPAFKRFAAIGPPMIPSPTNPTRSIAIRHLRCAQRSGSDVAAKGRRIKVHWEILRHLPRTGWRVRDSKDQSGRVRRLHAITRAARPTATSAGAAA